MAASKTSKAASRRSPAAAAKRKRGLPGAVDVTRKVGYRKPPEASRFKKGQSGNPKGRPKKSQNLRTIIQDVLLTNITVREGDKARSVSKMEGVVLRHTENALKGSERAALTMFRMAEQVGLIADSEASEASALSTAEEAILAEIMARGANPRSKKQS
jgi:hypothetical protein